jgi:hypothetical protein
VAASSDRTPNEGPGFTEEVSPLVASYAADDVALAALLRKLAEAPETCHACDAPIQGDPAGSGLLVWTRGTETHTEEPPLCEACATAIGLSALKRWQMEDEEG